MRNEIKNEGDKGNWFLNFMIERSLNGDMETVSGVISEQIILFVEIRLRKSG